MALRDQPYLPLYVQDFLTDEKLNMCSASTQGVYIKIMCLFHKSENYGGILLKQKDKQKTSNILNFALKLARLLPFDLQTISSALNELIDEDVLKIDGDFLFQKRMVNDNDLSIERAKSGSKGGKNTQNKYKKFALAKSEANTEYENENENINEDIINNKSYIKLFEKVNLEFKLNNEFENLILTWLKYKSEKNQSYKETGLKTFIKSILKDSNSSIDLAKKMIENSMKNNYTGVFPLKENNITTPKQPNILIDQALKTKEKLDKLYATDK